MISEPTLKKDKFILRKEVSVLVEGMPSFNFNDGKLYNDSCLRYNADLYRTDEGEQYYIFRALEYCTLFIMNCNKEVYRAISQQIELNDDIEIFDATTREGKEEYVSIPVSYRHEEGFGGGAFIFTN